MWTTIKTFFTGAAPKIIEWGAAGLSIAGILLGARQAGKDALRAAEANQLNKMVEQGHEVDTSVAKLPDGGAIDELRDKWQRK